MKKMLCVSLLIFAGLSTLYAETKTEYEPNVVIGDGKNGHSGGRWEQQIKAAPVKEVRMRLKRLKGDDKTFVNLRFGQKGQTFEGGKRVYITGDEIKVSWNVGGISPNGKPLVLIAYGGEVKVLKVAVIQE